MDITYSSRRATVFLTMSASSKVEACCVSRSSQPAPAKAADISAVSATGGRCEKRYQLADVDLFALYVMHAQAWYLVPASRVLSPVPKMYIRLYPDGAPRPGRHTSDHDYEPYREAWPLLGNSRRALAASAGRG